MTAQMVDEYLGAGLRGVALPCRECRSTGGYCRPDCSEPWRVRGYCLRCYYVLQKAGELGEDLYASAEEMLWHTTALVRQTHAVIDGYDHAAIGTAAEADAARWLASHPRHRVACLPAEYAAFGAVGR